jgi:serine/threonine-protein kinase
MLENVGRYKILSPLGKGAMGIVYLADDPVLSRQVAVKTIDLAIEDPTRREFLRTRLIRDARAAAALTHANIVSVFDVVEDGETAAIIMEFVAGENLGAYLSRNPVPESRFTLQVVRAMSAALDYTHSRNIVHRDIKPANVMLDPALTPKITDFGIARFTEGVTTTMTGAVMGTVEYMAPEQIKGEAVDGKADQFALAVITYRMLTGHTLFGEQSMATLAYKIVNENPAPVRSRNNWLPAAVDPVLAKALSKDPKDRYRTCTEFADALFNALTNIDREAPTIAMAPLKAKSASKVPALAFGGIAVVAAAAGGALWFNSESRRTATETSKPSVKVVAGALPSQAASAAAAPPTTPQPAVAPEPVKTVAKAAVDAAPKKAAEDVAAKPAKAEKAEKKAAPPEPEPPKPVEAAPITADDAMVHGRDLMKAQDYAGAIQAFSKAADLRPNWGQAYHSRGNAYRALEQYDAAIRDYSHAIRINPTMPNFFTSRAESYLKLQQDDAALADYTQALALKGDAPAILAARAAIYNHHKEYQKALTDLNEAIRLQPEVIVHYRQRAASKRGLGDAAGAKADVDKANELAAKKGGGE